MTTERGPVDVHAHCVPGPVVEAVTHDPHRFGVWPDWFEGTGTRLRIGGRLLRPLFDRMTDAGPGRLAEMDSMGVAEQFLSVWPDLIAYDLEAGVAREWHGLLNRSLRELADSSERFGWLAVVTLQDPDLSADEAVGAMQSGAVGLMIGSHVAGLSLASPDLDAFWRVVEDREFPLLIHPVDPSPDRRDDPYNLRAVTGYTSETTACLSHIILGGLLDRFPGLRLVGCHGGGFLPYQVGRLDRAHRLLRGLGAICEQAPSTYLPMLHYDSITHSVASLRFLTDLVGADQVLLGSDHPFGIGDDQPAAAARACGFDAGTEQRILWENAYRLFGLPGDTADDLDAGS